MAIRPKKKVVGTKSGSAPKKKIVPRKKVAAAPPEEVEEVEEVEEETEEVEEEVEEVEEEVEEVEEEVEEAPPPKKKKKVIEKKLVIKKVVGKKKPVKKAPPTKKGKPATKKTTAKPAAKKTAGKRRGIVLGGRSAGKKSFKFTVNDIELTVPGELPEEGSRIPRDTLMSIVHEYLETSDLGAPESKKITADLVTLIEDTLIAVTGDYSLKFMDAMFRRVFIQERFFGSIIDGASSSLMPAHCRSKYDRNIEGVESVRGEIDEDGDFVPED